MPPRTVDHVRRPSRRRLHRRRRHRDSRVPGDLAREADPHRGPPGVGKTALAKALDDPRVPARAPAVLRGDRRGKARMTGRTAAPVHPAPPDAARQLHVAASLGEAVKRLAGGEPVLLRAVPRPTARPAELPLGDAVGAAHGRDRSGRRRVRGAPAGEPERLPDLDPELGVIEARQKPLVILTSNATRLISDALRRRCLYLYIGYPSSARGHDRPAAGPRHVRAARAPARGVPAQGEDPRPAQAPACRRASTGRRCSRSCRSVS